MISFSLLLAAFGCGESSTPSQQGSSGGSGATSSGGSGLTAGAGPNGGVSASSGNASGGNAGTPGNPNGGNASSGSAGTPGNPSGGNASGGSAGTPGNGGNAGTAGAGATGGLVTAGGTGGAAPSTPPPDEDGSELWLRYRKVAHAERLAEYAAGLNHVVKAGASASLQAAEAELLKGLSGLTGKAVVTSDQPTGDGAVVLGTPASSTLVKALPLTERLATLGTEGYLVELADIGGKKAVVVAANTDIGVLRGSFALLRHLQCERPLQGLALKGVPKIKRRLLNHWDNLDGTVERGYAGRSLWAWSSLPATISQRYKDYARANASLGINGTVLTNVNSTAQILTAQNLDKIAALAATFRPYGITVYLTARFSAPIELGKLTTADPLSADVKAWWTSKAAEIYEKIPDFGGFLVKANAEGQPGPQDYGRTHADGAKMLSEALGARGIVMWRAFVYKDNGMDRIRQAYDEFKPLDGTFGTTSMIQVKNGPLDFQPREPQSPLFGALVKTPVALELQITKEYLGEDTHLAYLGPMFEQVLKADTNGQGMTVARVIDDTAKAFTETAIAGVANIGLDTNWTGSHFNQANWYAYGRMAWDPDASAQDLADEWIRQTFSNDPAVVTPVTAMMMGSHQTLVNYMTPLGLAHIMDSDHHYGPGPWISNLSQANWNPVYYHKADAAGIGFDRTSTGSKAVDQYAPAIRDKFASRATVPDDFLLFFHKVGWDEKLTSSGRTLWEELVHRYSAGVDGVATMRSAWKTVERRVDAKRFKEVDDFLQIQHYEARWWRDACLQFFASVSKHTIPAGYAPPANDLQFYKTVEGKCPRDLTKPRCPDIYTGEPSPAILK